MSRQLILLAIMLVGALACSEDVNKDATRFRDVNMDLRYDDRSFLCCLIRDDQSRLMVKSGLVSNFKYYLEPGGMHNHYALGHVTGYIA